MTVAPVVLDAMYLQTCCLVDIDQARIYFSYDLFVLYFFSMTALELNIAKKSCG